MNVASLMTRKKPQQLGDNDNDDYAPEGLACATEQTSSSSEDSSNSTDSNHASSDEAQRQERLRKFRAFLRDFSLWKLVDPSQPWVLVEEGSFMGAFDWIPRPMRVGPWSVAALSYIFVMYYLLFLAGAFFYSSVSQDPQEEAIPSAEQQELLAQLSYPGPWTPQWMYQVAGFCWMNFIIYLVLNQSPLAKAAWATFTIQSWSWMTVRHFLCATAPWSRSARLLADWMRFPVAFSATTTFVLWNTLIFPILYVFGMKTAEKRRDFLKFCYSFRMVNIHFVNMVLCLLNCGTWANPPSRPLGWFDFYLGFAYSMVYITWYLCVLDRLGVHFYPVFSPRLVGWKLVVAWTTLVGTLLACFFGWRHFLLVPQVAIVDATTGMQTSEAIMLDKGDKNASALHDAWVERATMAFQLP